MSLSKMGNREIKNVIKYYCFCVCKFRELCVTKQVLKKQEHVVYTSLEISAMSDNHMEY